MIDAESTSCGKLREIYRYHAAEPNSFLESWKREGTRWAVISRTESAENNLAIQKYEEDEALPHAPSNTWKQESPNGAFACDSTESTIATLCV